MKSHDFYDLQSEARSKNFYFDFDDFTIIPRESSISERSEIQVDNSILCSSPMDTVTGAMMIKAMRSIGCDSVVHRYQPIEDIIELSAHYDHQLMIAIGSLSSHKSEIDKLIKAGVTKFVLDVAHGGSRKAIETLLYIREKLQDKAWLCSGSICTQEAAYDNIFGPDYILVNALRVGVGPGSSCETRKRIGVGLPLPSTIVEIRGLCERIFTTPVTIIGDGGIRNSGDFVKAIACGADKVFVGTSFGATEEAEGKRYYFTNLTKEQEVYKQIRGMASESALIDHNKESKNLIAIEGKEQFVKVEGSVKDIAYSYLNSLKQAMFYTGAKTIDEFQEKVLFAFLK